jgi:hypothetical protein
LDVKQFERTTMYAKCNDPGEHVAFCLAPAWGKDYPDATTFAEPLFGSASLGPDACCNYSLVGAPPEFLQKYDYTVTSVPSADAQIDECEPLVGDERLQCWAEFDQYLMNEVVPWVPYLLDNDVDVTSSRVVNHIFDQSVGLVALDHIALTPEDNE